MGLFSKGTKGGKPPRDKACDGLDISFQCDSEAPGKERRGALRVQTPGLMAAIVGLEKALPVRDISVLGGGLVFKGKRIKAGVRFKVTLRQGDTVYAEAVTARVMRHEGGVLGVAWQEPDRHQSEGLHKIVLEAQKRQADQRRGKKDLPDDIKDLKL